MQKLVDNAIAPRSGKARQLVIFLHGYGANGDDLLSIGHEWAEGLPDAAFAAPNAPEVCEAYAGGYQWFSIRAIDPAAFERDQSAARVAPVLDAYIDAQLEKWGVAPENLAVAGFSQGAMMAMYAMPRRARPCGAVIGYSGMLLDAAGLKAPGIVKMPVLAIHGAADDIVPPESLEKVDAGFTAAGFDVETALRPGLGHGIDPFGMTRGLQFIQESFGLIAEAAAE
jgi:phospholipase/carboxylesterase